MQKVSRRAVLAAGIGVAGVAAAAAGTYGLVEAGILPGKYRLAQVLGECGAAPPPPRGVLPTREDAVFWSAYRKRMVGMVTLIPAAAATSPAPPALSSSLAPPAASSPGTSASPRTADATRGLGVAIALHGLDSSAIGAANLYAPAMTTAGVTRFAVIAVDGGNTYWHRRSDGDDPLGMIIHEVLPRAADRGLAVARIGIIGYSMGGYGALLLAERLGAGSAGSVGLTANGARARPEPTPAAVAAASPAIFGSYQDARAADPGSFDSPSDFARNDVIAGLGGLRGVPAWVACGSSDPFEQTTQLLLSRVGQLTGRPAAGGVQAGCHDEAFWARSAPAGLEFIGRHLPDAS
jgi:S-formylglutathione hydrolase FrmB